MMVGRSDPASRKWAGDSQIPSPEDGYLSRSRKATRNSAPEGGFQNRSRHPRQHLRNTRSIVEWMRRLGCRHSRSITPDDRIQKRNSMLVLDLSRDGQGRGFSPHSSEHAICRDCFCSSSQNPREVSVANDHLNSSLITPDRVEDCGFLPPKSHSKASRQKFRVKACP